MRKIMSETINKTKVNKRTVVIATAVTTLLSATAALAIKAFRKPKLVKEEKSEVEIVLDGLVEAGTITQAQQDAIQNAIIAAKEASAVSIDLTPEEIIEVTIVPESDKPNTLTKLKNSLTKGTQNKDL